MDDLISRQAAIDALDEYIEEYSFDLDENGYHNPKWCAMQEAKMTIQRLPSVERRGRWIFNIDDKGWSWDKPYMCDQCGEWVEKVFKFCPNCGSFNGEGGENEELQR